MKNQTYRMTMLFDFYGELLTPRQREFYDLYYNEDLSLAEIAENHGITRQGVRDNIVRAEATLQDIEDKTGLISRYHTIQNSIDALEKAALDIRNYGEGTLQDPKLLDLCFKLDEAIAALGKD